MTVSARTWRERLLGVPKQFEGFKKLISLGKDRSVFAREHIRAEAGMRVLDIGCGTGDVLEFLPDVDYTGFDLSAEYIEKAKARYGDRGHFYCRRVSEESLPERADYDLVLAQGVLHHLDDTEATKLVSMAHAALKPGGRFVTLDGVYTPEQSPIARFILSRDRGEHVRREPEYVRLATTVFSEVRSTVREDLLAIPYSLLVLECTKSVR